MDHVVGELKQRAKMISTTEEIAQVGALCTLGMLGVLGAKRAGAGTGGRDRWGAGSAGGRALERPSVFK